MGILDPPTPTPAPLGTSMSSKTPGRDFDDRCSLDMKLSVKLPWDILGTLTPSLASSITSLSSKTPRRDLEDKWSLDKLPYIGS